MRLPLHRFRCPPLSGKLRTRPAVAGHRPPKPEPESGITLIDWAVKYAGPLLGVGGALLFGVLRMAYVVFYEQLRATPQEVGYGYQEILTGQLFGTVELTMLLTAVLVGARLLARAIRHAAAGRWREATRRPPRDVLKRLVRRCGLAALAGVLVVLPVFAYLFGLKATYGYTIRNMYLFSPVLQLLAIQASPAEVVWTTQPQPGMADPRSLRCLLYLGHADGIAVFYDVRTRASLHLPAGLIQLTLPKSNEVDESCT